MAHAASRLPNVVANVIPDYKQFNHLDFLWAKDVDTLLYKDVVDLMNKYRKHKLT